MPVRSFLDTNVLVYADDNGAPDKRDAAMALYGECRRTGSGVVSIQVLQEYFVAATKNLGVPAEMARRRVQLLKKLDVVIPRAHDVLAAIDLHRLHQLSFWDAMIVRAATTSGCTRLYSEDLQHHRRIDGLEVVNPFV
jgi:predicted nucleic acid-binding protein